MKKPLSQKRTETLGRKIAYRALLGAQILVGFGLFGAASTAFTAFLPLLWIACLGNRARFGRLTRAGVRHGFGLVFTMLGLLRVMRLETRFSGPVSGPALLACNHISLFDVLAVISHVPHCYTFVKADFVRMPILRYIIFAAGFIPVDPLDPAQSAEAFSRALDLLRAGAVFVVFPEGTRSQTGRVGVFHKGAFRLARQAGVSLVPVTFTASGPLLNKRIVKRADGQPVLLRMDVAPAGAHLLEAGLEAPGLGEEMEALRAFFDRRFATR